MTRDVTPKTLDQKKQRWKAIMDPDSGVQVLTTVVFRDDPEIPPRPWPHPKNDGILQEWALRKCSTMQERAAWLCDDAIPFVDLFTGTEIFAEAFGCPVHRPDDNMPFALPLVDTAAEVARLKVPDLESTGLYDRILKAERLRARAGSGALVRLPDIQTPMDIAALIWKKESFYMALIEEPEAVRELAEKTGQLLMTFMDAWFDRMGSEYIAHYPDYYMDGGITVSEDEIGAVSPDCFDTLFFPELEDLSRRYGGMGLHCCAHARHQWPGLAKIPGLKLVNLIQPEEVLQDSLPVFAHVAQLHNWDRGLPAGRAPDAVTDRVRVVLTPPVRDREEAERLLERWAGCATLSDILRAEAE